MATPSSDTDAARDAAVVTGNEAWSMFSRMIAGMLVYGAIGWLVGGWLGSSTAGLATGVLLGLLLGMGLSFLRLRSLGTEAPAIEYPGSRSWSARMTRARIERSKEVANGE